MRYHQNSHRGSFLFRENGNRGWRLHYVFPYWRNTALLSPRCERWLRGPYSFKRRSYSSSSSYVLHFSQKRTSIVVGINTLRITEAITHMRKSPRTIVTIPKIPIAIEISNFFFLPFRGKNQQWSMFSLSTHLSTWTRRRRWEARCCPWRRRLYDYFLVCWQAR